ncbi:MAG: retropepsin-like domain-containing protein [Pirellulales bacterium]|nr:retropepsin-like domain-containing protein [Pirellulales bacterium]
MIRVGIVVGIWFVLGLVAGGGAGAAENTAAADFLAKQGLVRDGNTWLSPVEAKVKGYFDAIRELERNVITAEKAFAAGLRESESLKQEVAQLEAELQKLNELLQSGTLNAAQGERVTAQAQQRADRINLLKPQVMDPAGLDDSAMIKAAVNRVNEARNALAVALLYLRAHAAEVDGSYAALTTNQDVQDALTALGGKQKLGPLKRYDRDLKRLDRLDRLVFTETVLAYRDNARPRVSAIVNEQTAATFTWGEEVAMTYLPHSVALAAGLAIPDDAPRVDVLAAGNRKIEAHKVTLPKLRFGQQVLENIEVVVLAPDAEDMGAVLSPRSLGDRKAVVDTAKLEFRLLPFVGDSDGDRTPPAPRRRAPRAATP